jgi:hypothetical protein
MNGERTLRNAADTNADTSADIRNSPRLGSASMQENITQMNKTKIILRLPDGRTITIVRDLPRLPLGV